MANLKGVFLHKSDDWATPKFIYDKFVNECGYYDPCPLHSDRDCLLVDNWNGIKNIFINPPYSNIEAFVDKAIREFNFSLNQDIVFLLPVRTDTRWFKKLSNFGCDIRFFRGRLKFGDSKGSAPFPSMLVRLDPFRSSFSDRHINKFYVIEGLLL